MKLKQDVFQHMPVPKAVATLAIPTVLSMLVTVIYNMADTFFVGQTNDANQVAAVSLTMPVFFILMAFGNMFGIGGSSFISRLLGQGEHEKVKKVSSFCFYGSIIISVAMMFAFLLGMSVILKLMGADANTELFARDYLTVIAYGAPFVILSTMFGNLVRGEGASKTAMIGMMIGTILNIILDPIMILWMDMGVTGAALATIIGNIASVIYYIFYFIKGNSSLSISYKDFKVVGIIGGVLAIGIPASLNNILMSTSNIVLNNFLKDYGTLPVAAMGVAMKANMLLILMQLGIAMGIQPLVGYCYGARNYKRMKAVMKFSMMCTVIMGTILTIVYFIATKPIIRIFIDNPEVTKLGVSMLRASMLAGPVIGVLFVFNFTIQAMGKAIPSLIITISRQGLVFVPVLFLSNYLFGLDGIIYSQAISDIAALLMAATAFFLIYRKLDHKGAIE